jgi:hypothetical protein
MRRCWVAALAIVLGGCGYVGDPLPPALDVPLPIADLQVIQRGEQLFINFTIPALTTDQLPVRELSKVELRIGKADKPLSVDAWSSNSTEIGVTATKPGPQQVVTSARPWQGQEVAVGVRLVNKKGRLSAWSNLGTLAVAAPLPRPVDLRASLDPEGVKLEWQSKDASSLPAQFRIFRASEKEPKPVQIGVSDQLAFVDRGATLGVPQIYTVQATRESVESEQSESVTITPKDIFAPGPPSGFSAVVGLASVELGWSGNPEADLKGYRIYRGEGTPDAQALTKTKPLLELSLDPAFSDRQVVSGKSYRYVITAIDQSGNESAPSTAADAVAP